MTADTEAARVATELNAMVERLQGKVPADLIAVLMPSLMDAAYNAEYERKNLSAWESPEYRPYCMSCSTMRRMEHRDYGYQCSVCGAKAAPHSPEDSPDAP
jgi:RNA polymerase-binding transcription factor DksA